MAHPFKKWLEIQTSDGSSRSFISPFGTLGRSSSLRGERPNSFPRRLKGLFSGKAKGHAGLNRRGNKNKLAFNHFSRSWRSCFFAKGWELLKLRDLIGCHLKICVSARSRAVLRFRLRCTFRLFTKIQLGTCQYQDGAGELEAFQVLKVSICFNVELCLHSELCLNWFQKS